MYVKIEPDKGLKIFAFGVSPPTRVTDLQIGPFQGVRFLYSCCSLRKQQEYDRLRFLKSSAWGACNSNMRKIGVTCRLSHYPSFSAKVFLGSLWLVAVPVCLFYTSQELSSTFAFLWTERGKLFWWDLADGVCTSLNPASSGTCENPSVKIPDLCIS